MNAILRTKMYKNIPVDQHIEEAIVNLRLNIDSDNPNKLLELNSFKDYHKMLFTDISGTQGCIVNEYIKNVSSEENTGPFWDQ